MVDGAPFIGLAGSRRVVGNCFRVFLTHELCVRGAAQRWPPVIAGMYVYSALCVCCVLDSVQLPFCRSAFNA